MALFAERQFDHALRREVLEREHYLVVADDCVVDAQPAALDLAPRLAVGRDKAGPDEQRQHADAGFEFAARNFHARQVFGDGAFLKRFPRSLCSFSGRIGAVQQCGRRIGERFLGLVDFRAP